MPVNLGWPCWIGIVAQNLPAQRRFYRDTLGFAERGAGGDWVQFDLGQGRLLELIQQSRAEEYNRKRYQVGYAVEDVETAEVELHTRGVEAVSGLKGGASAGGRWQYFRDPEGNVFEIKECRTDGGRPPTGIAWPTWIGVVADNLAVQRRFYRDVLDLAELGAHSGYVEFDMGEGRRVELVQRSDAPQYDQAGYQVAFAVHGIQSVRNQLHSRKVRAISGLKGTLRTGGRWCYFEDPEGNTFAIKEQSPA
jgi:predicted enzyme related to lactoylglutathione lyase